MLIKWWLQVISNNKQQQTTVPCRHNPAVFLVKDILSWMDVSQLWQYCSPTNETHRKVWKLEFTPLPCWLSKCNMDKAVLEETGYKKTEEQNFIWLPHCTENPKLLILWYIYHIWYIWYLLVWNISIICLCHDTHTILWKLRWLFQSPYFLTVWHGETEHWTLMLLSGWTDLVGIMTSNPDRWCHRVYVSCPSAFTIFRSYRPLVRLALNSFVP